MRRRSVVGPVLLILLGAAFLINTSSRTEPVLVGCVYWPFLLIAMGVLRLMEVLAYAASSKPLPAKGTERRRKFS
jgi:hypothetical protein